MLAINYRSRLLMANKMANELFNKGVVAEKSNLYGEAISFYKSAIKLDPLFRKAFINMGVLYSKSRKYEKAKASFFTAYKLGADHNVYFNLASIEYKLGDNEKAIKMLRDLLSRKADMLVAHLLISHIYEQIKKDALAEKHLLSALRIDPANKKALSVLTLFYFDREKNEKALEYMDILLKKYPGEKAMQGIRAALALRSKDYAGALKKYQELADSDPKFSSFQKTLEGLNKEEKQMIATEIPTKLKEKTIEVKKKLEELKGKKAGNDPEALKGLVDLSFYHMFNGDPKEGMKYLLYAKKLKDGSTKDHK